MNPIKHSLPAAFVLLGALVVLLPPLFAEEPAATRLAAAVERAEAVLAAWRAEDDAALTALARSERPDPLHVTDVLLVRYARARIASADVEALLGAARAYATAAPGEVLPDVLGTLVEGWTKLEDADLERALRLADAWTVIEEAGAEGKWRDVLGTLERVEADGSLGLDTVAAVEIHHGAALALEFRRRTPDVLRHGRRGAEVAERIGWHAKSGHLWHWTARFATRVGSYEEAREMALEAVAAFARLDVDPPRPVLHHDLTIATYRTGRLKEAVPIGLRAREMAFAAANPHEAARILGTLSGIYMYLGDAERSIRAAEEAIQEAKAIGAREVWVGAMATLVGTYASIGQYAEAIATAEEVLATPEAEANPQLFAATSANLAIALGHLEKIDEAIGILEVAIRKARAAGLEATVRQLELSLTATLHCTEYVSRAPDVLLRILAYFEETENRWGIAQVLSTLAATYACLERVEEASAMEAAALKAYAELGDRLGAAIVHTRVALAHEKRRQWPAALEANTAALEVYRALGSRDEHTAAALFARARLLTRSGDPEPAIPFLAEAMEIYLDHLHGLGDEDALKLAARARAVSDWAVGIAAVLVGSHPERGAEAAAIAYHHLELARAILLAEALANARRLLDADLPPEVRRDDAASRKRVEVARRRLAHLAGKGGEAAAIEAAKRELDEAWDGRKAVVARVQREARRVASITHPEIVPLADLQARLDRKTVFVSYRLWEEGYALVVTDEDAAIVTLSGSEAIRDAVRAYLRVVSTPELSDEKLAARLYGMLVEPLEDHLGQAEHLIISPDAELAYLPFAALLDEKRGNGERLIQRRAVSMVPSATVLVTLRDEVAAEPSGHVLCVGDPVYPAAESGRNGGAFERLPESGAEAREVAAFFPPDRRTVLLREDATVAELKRLMDEPPGRFRAMHFACHALVDTERPRRSGLALSGGEMLDVDAILSARFPSCLVVLSACETARGQLAQSEGVMGFTRAFFYAGVPRVVASSWQISDASTRPLMRAFYEAYVKEGLPPAKALQRAQVLCLEQGGDRAHPYHWAAFTLWGLDP